MVYPMQAISGKWSFMYFLVLDFPIVPGIPQLFLHRNFFNNIDAAVAKVSDYVLIGASSSFTAWFVQQFKSQFDVGRVVVNENMHFNGSFISVSADGYTLDIAEPLSRIQPIAIDDVRRTSPLLLLPLQKSNPFARSQDHSTSAVKPMSASNLHCIRNPSALGY
jgi:hypothetical protein